jgi:hypothetical protein
MRRVTPETPLLPLYDSIAGPDLHCSPPLADDCCHTGIAIEHNHGAHCSGGNASAAAPHAGRGSVSGCPSEYYAMADIRREILAADPYHLVFGAVARCYGDGAWYWSEEGAGLGIDVPMHESYGSGINTGAGGQRIFPMEWSPLINMPDPTSVGQASAVHARIYGDGLSGDTWGINCFNFGGGPGGVMNYVIPEVQRGVSSYALEMGELVPSMLSTVWTTNGGSCAFWGDGGGGDGCATSVRASIYEMDALPHMATSGQAHPLRVVSRLLVESPPPDALPNYHCMHVITVVEGSSPIVVEYAFVGLPAGATSMRRIFGGDVYDLNISAGQGADTGVAHDVAAGKSAIVHRIGCEALTMLPPPDARELVKGGDMEAVAGSGPGIILSDHHSGPWLLEHTGVVPDPLRPGQLVRSGAPLTDDRARISSDAASARFGRHSARVLVPSAAAPVYFPVPIGTPPPGVFHATLSLWARCSPAGLRLGPALAGKLLPKEHGGRTVALGAEWGEFRFAVAANGSTPAGGGKRSLLSLQLSSPFATGGRVWIDALSLRCDNGTGEQPCPSIGTAGEQAAP